MMIPKQLPLASHHVCGTFCLCRTHHNLSSLCKEGLLNTGLHFIFKKIYFAAPKNRWLIVDCVLLQCHRLRASAFAQIIMDIKIENLSKRYGPQRAVDNISFEVKTGEILGFLGPNGAGKTTTMKMITGYLSITEGDIQIGGQSLRKTGDEIKRHIGYLQENNPLYLEMPVMEYLHFCAALQGVRADKVEERTRLMVSQCGLNSEKHKKIGELSKGFRQRVGLAQAMIHNPEILVLDEPTTGLDPNQIVEIRKLIREIGKEKTVILSTHILPEVEATCDRILIINKGRIVADGTSHTLRKQASGSELLKIRIEDGTMNEIEQALRTLPSVAKVEVSDVAMNRFEVQSKTGHTSKREIFKLCVEKNWMMTELTPLETRLEDIFRNLTMN
ncbi:MAG: Gliding motility-associated ABC transporter ATP-binding protein GldA [Cytophagales bacterium]|jgi:ABC-2 type transport system ATP-binding protein|nr:MAG: Gliding motility-associated ABC transporter ATP-binding protein GldA [Cytophagales bacterium]